jgi:Na+/phosphate symporter
MAKPVPHTDARIDEAMNSVLEKERQSRERIEQCEQEAAALLDRAQRRARAVSDRTDKRITAFRQRCAETTQRAVDGLLAEDSERSERTSEHEQDFAQIEAAVRRLAERLTGDAADDADGAASP